MFLSSVSSPPEGASAITPYVRIDAQGVTIITPRAEMGQGIQKVAISEPMLL